MSLDITMKVALIARNADSGKRVRATVTVLGTPIVYESTAAEFDSAALEQSGAQVVVVALDDDDSDFDAIFELAADDRYRFVFDDSKVSGGLTGSDHARWARHLAAKILDVQIGLDPPRPGESDPLVTQAARNDEAIAALADRLAPRRRHGDQRSTSGSLTTSPSTGVDDWLSKVLASEDPTAYFSIPGGTIAAPPISVGAPIPTSVPQRNVGDTDIPISANSASVSDPFSPDQLGADPIGTDLPSADPGVSDRIDADAISSMLPGIVDEIEPAASAIDDIDFSSIDFAVRDSAADHYTVAAEGSNKQSMQPVSPAASEWTLDAMLDDLDALLDGEKPALSPSFAPIEVAPKIAAEPSAEIESEKPTASATAPAKVSAFASSLELVPIEEEVPAAPLKTAPSHEFRLDTATPFSRIKRVIVLCASIGGPEAIRQMLGALPRDYPALFMVVQHVGEEFMDLLTQQLKRATPLNVRKPVPGERVSHGDVLAIPPGQRVLVDRQGSVSLTTVTVALSTGPSMDQVLTDVADAFGRDATAVIFSGLAADAVAGCKYLSDKGGTIYAQDPSTCIVSTMIDEVRQTGAVSYLGSPWELAGKLMTERDQTKAG
ncbi:MAG: chemotaxis protein CheB [Dokdonella sp.]